MSRVILFLIWSTVVFGYDFVYPVAETEEPDPSSYHFQVNDPISAEAWTNPNPFGSNGYTCGHLGIDLVRDNVDHKRVYAIWDGTVVIATNGETDYGWCDNASHGWGRVIVIRHELPSGQTFSTENSILTSSYEQPDEREGSTEQNPRIVYSLYGHLSPVDFEVSFGQQVQRGQPIARIGTHEETGFAGSEAHLHFEIKSQTGFDFGVWSGVGCSGTGDGLTQSCQNDDDHRGGNGVGSGYSHIASYVPDHYDSWAFIAGNQSLAVGQGSSNPEAFIDCYNRIEPTEYGEPVSTVYPIENGEVQEFLENDGEAGAMYRLAGSDVAYYVHGGIYAHYYYVMNGAEGILGFPVTDEHDSPESPYETEGRQSIFEHGCIEYISSTTNPIAQDHIGESFAIYGLIWTAFQERGRYTSWLGFPTSPIVHAGSNMRMEMEEGGYLLSTNGRPAQFHSATSPRQLIIQFYSGLIRLNWLELSPIESAIYVVRYPWGAYREQEDTLAVLPTNTTMFDDATAQAGQDYSYYIIAASDAVFSEQSNHAFARLQNSDWDIYLNAAEYYYDDDPGHGSGNLVSFPPTTDASLTVGADVASLAPGFHRVFLRYLDSRGIWSAPEGRSFYVTSPIPQGTLTINTAEVFYDSDPGVGNASSIPVTAGDEVAVTTSPDVSDLDPGFHRLFLRYRTNSNVWSATEGRSFYVTSPVPEGAQMLASAEYFLDIDPGTGMGTAIDFEDTSDVTLTHSVDPFAESVGFHRLFLRYQTAGGTWSAPEGRSLYVTSAQSDTNFIAGGEIFVDTLMGYGQGTAMLADDALFDSTVESMHLDFSVVGLELGQHYVYARVRDATGIWSNTVVDSFSIIEAQNIELVAMADSTGEHIVLTWSSVPNAIEYHVHSDSVSTGEFTAFQVVIAPDSSLSVDILLSEGREFFKVVAVLPSTNLMLRIEAPETSSKSPKRTPANELEKGRHK